MCKFLIRLPASFSIIIIISEILDQWLLIQAIIKFENTCYYSWSGVGPQGWVLL